MVFQLCKTATSVSTKVLCSSREFSVISIYSEMDKSTLLTQMCADFSFPRWPCSHRRRRAIQLKWVQDKTAGSLTASLLASFASYLLISWQKPSRFFATTVKYFPQIFNGVNFQRSKSLVGKTFAIYLKSAKTAKVFSPWNFCHLR